MRKGIYAGHCACFVFRFANFVRSHAEIKALISWQPAAEPNWHRRRQRTFARSLARSFVRSFVRSFARSHGRLLADAIEGRESQGYSVLY